VTREALWPWSLEAYGRPGVESLLLELQDVHGQNVPYLLWALWMAASGRLADDATLAEGALLARTWDETAVAPLRNMRRGLKQPVKPGAEAARSLIRGQVTQMELDAERRGLEMLETASPAPGVGSDPPLRALNRAVQAWGAAPPALLLVRLAALIA
jgi:uncharacterized protein (TIGR02444 family)